MELKTHYSVNSMHCMKITIIFGETQNCRNRTNRYFVKMQAWYHNGIYSNTMTFSEKTYFAAPFMYVWFVNMMELYYIPW